MAQDLFTRLRKWIIILPPSVWLVLFFVIPFLLVLRLSLSDAALARPPYAPHFDISAGWEGFRAFLAGLDFDNYGRVLGDSLYISAYLNSVKIATIATLVTLAIGYPVAYAIACASPRVQPALITLVIMPFWTSLLIRVYAWMGILSDSGYLNQLLQWAGITDAPIRILNTTGAIYIGMVYAYLPFVVLPIYAMLQKMDRSLIEAATDLGCTRLSAFWRITFPLSLPGVGAGAFLVFVPSVGEFVIPSLLGGSGNLMIGRVLWDEFFASRDWPMAATVAVLLLLVLMGPIAIYQHLRRRSA